MGKTHLGRVFYPVPFSSPFSRLQSLRPRRQPLLWLAQAHIWLLLLLPARSDHQALQPRAALWEYLGHRYVHQGYVLCSRPKEARARHGEIPESILKFSSCLYTRERTTYNRAILEQCSTETFGCQMLGGVRVDRCQWVIEQHVLSIRIHRSGERDSGFLTTTESDTSMIVPTDSISNSPQRYTLCPNFRHVTILQHIKIRQPFHDKPQYQSRNFVTHKAHASKVASYLFSSYCSPKRILSLIDFCCNQGVCEAYATLFLSPVTLSTTVVSLGR